MLPHSWFLWASVFESETWISNSLYVTSLYETCDSTLQSHKTLHDWPYNTPHTPTPTHTSPLALSLSTHSQCSLYLSGSFSLSQRPVRWVKWPSNALSLPLYPRATLGNGLSWIQEEFGLLMKVDDRNPEDRCGKHQQKGKTKERALARHEVPSACPAGCHISKTETTTFLGVV